MLRFRRPFLRATRGGLLAALVAAGAACAPQLPSVPSGPPAADPRAVETELVRATTPDGPRQVNFTWELDEAGSRVRGRGVVRAEAPDRLRLDLFGPRGETYLAAALVGESFRVPPAVAERFPLPSPALLWGAMGVVRPPAGGRLAGATATGGAASLRYELDGGETLELGAEAMRVRTLRRSGGSGALESVSISYSPAGALRRAEYRDRGAYRTLVLNVESITDAAPFPPATWLPDAAR
jgi:hypothetical protein